MKILNILVSGYAGGIESLYKNVLLNDSDNEHFLCFMFEAGQNANEAKEYKKDNVFILNNKKNKPIKLIKRILDIIKKEKINVVVMQHLGLYCDIIYYILRKLTNKNVKFVRQLHSCYEPKYFSKSRIKLFFIDLFLKKAFKSSDLIVSVSKAVEKSFKSRFKVLKKKKCTIVYNGIGLNFFKKTINKSKYINNIIYVGRLEKYKSVDTLIEVFKEIKEIIPSANLTIVGDGSEKQSLIKLSNNLKLNQSITFTGTQYNVIDWLDKSSIFVYPSSWMEAFRNISC